MRRQKTAAEQALDAAREKAEEIQRQRAARESQLHEEVRALQDRHRRIVEAEFGEAERAANSAVYDAKTVVDAERVAKAEAETYCGLPVGTKLVQWSSGPYSHDYRLSGVSGVLQVYKAGDPCPANRRWGLPDPGQFIVRHLKKDGAESSRFDRAQDWWWGMFNNGPWLPEGMTPEQAMKAEEKRMNEEEAADARD